MPSVAATSPPVVIAHLAAHTTRLRLGSGGVGCPTTLRWPSPSSSRYWRPRTRDVSTSASAELRAPTRSHGMALRGAAGRDDRDIEQAFPEYLDDVVALMGARGVRVPIPNQRYVLKATPAAVTEPKLWLLGSSMYSAHLAAAKGLPSGVRAPLLRPGAAEAFGRVPVGVPAERTGARTVDVPHREHDDGDRNTRRAVALALPDLQMMARLRTGQPLGALDLVEDAQSAVVSSQAQHIAEAVASIRGRITDGGGRADACAGAGVRCRRGHGQPGRVGAPRTDPATAPARDKTWNCRKSCSSQAFGVSVMTVIGRVVFF